MQTNKSDRQTEEEDRKFCEDIENFLENDKAAAEEENDYTIDNNVKPDIRWNLKHEKRLTTSSTCRHLHQVSLLL
jgi:uncharacterized membrane-anchored protein